MRCLSKSFRFDCRRPIFRLYTTAAQLDPVFSLRPYQETCLEACTDALKAGVSRIGVSLPTGSGKTTVFITLLSLVKPPPGNPEASRSLVIVNSVELALQTVAQTKRLFPQWTVEIEQGSQKASGLADLTVATYQTLLRPLRLEKLNPARLKAVIVDEAHHAAAPSYRHILSRFNSSIVGPDKDLPPPALPHTIPIFGFSATFSRHDGLALGSVFERIVYHRDFLEMIKEQWLCNVLFTSIRADIDLRNVTVNAKSGDFNATSIAQVVNTKSINTLVVQAWLDRASQRKSTLVFCVNLAHVRDLTATFREAGVDARYIHAGTPAPDRKALIADFRAGTFPVLLNCAILTEGADIPNIDCVVVAKPTRSRNVFAQMIGRGMRLSPQTGKINCHIIDFVDTFGRVSGVASVPHLFGLDPSEIIDGKSIFTVEELEERAKNAIDLDNLESSPEANDTVLVPAPKSVTYIDYEDPFAFVHGYSGAPNAFTVSPYAWVGCGGDTYILDCLGKGWIKVEPFHDLKHPELNYRVTYTPAMPLPLHVTRSLKISPYQRSRHVLDATNLNEAFKGSDTYVKSKILSGQMLIGLLRSAAWRRQPATEGQRDFIQKRWEKRQIVDDESPKKSQKNIARLLRGEAANIITRIKHGAQTHFEKRLKSQRKFAAAAAKEQRRVAREHVAVGPLKSS
ncbi:P-loop containing nucleoside triphosphate hydrolase protein [Irpex rosettiformis]|uniref:P-loop containing nucleoside triphosphate hydrolase protein n=1 Tax=Irpex rosettiformis TaxID=378272 RepID=A0ACB8UKD0_9APHY|nr:P-loop containing nucleoside triphosphate hydrolase protein [Irpex rosettiformis]